MPCPAAVPPSPPGLTVFYVQSLRSLLPLRSRLWPYRGRKRCDSGFQVRLQQQHLQKIIFLIDCSWFMICFLFFILYLFIVCLLFYLLQAIDRITLNTYYIFSGQVWWRWHSKLKTHDTFKQEWWSIHAMRVLFSILTQLTDPSHSTSESTDVVTSGGNSPILEIDEWFILQGTLIIYDNYLIVTK